VIEVRPRRGIELPAGLPKSARRSRKKNLIRRLVETYQGQPMQLSKMARVRDGDTVPGQRASDCVDRPVVQTGPIPNWTRTNGLSGLLAVGNLDRGWIVALVWTLGTKVEGEIKMLTRFGMIFYWCSLAIAFACWIAAIIILMAIIMGKLSGSEVWMSAIFFSAVGACSWLAGRAADSIRS